jgi:hypothetical protein
MMSRVPPRVEIAPDRTLGREVLGQETLLTARPQEVEGGIDNSARVGLARPTAGVTRQVRLDQCPLLIGDVTGVRLCSHTSFDASPP